MATKGSKITKAFLLQWFVAYVLLVATELGTEKLWWQVLRAEARAELPAKADTLTIIVSVHPKGCYAVGKRVEAQSASRVGARQAGPSARRAGRGWTHVRTGPRNTAIESGWRVTHATLLANANAYSGHAPLKGQAGMPDLRESTKRLRKDRRIRQIRRIRRSEGKAGLESGSSQSAVGGRCPKGMQIHALAFRPA